MSVEIEMVPFTIISGEDKEAIEIVRYLEKSKKVSRLGVGRYTYATTDDDDGLVFLLNGYRAPFQKSGTTILRKLLAEIQYDDGGNFRRVYIEIGFIAHLLMLINREQRSKNKPIPKLVRQAIRIYQEVSPANFEIYQSHRNSIRDANLADSIMGASFVAILTLIGVIMVLATLMIVHN